MKKIIYSLMFFIVVLATSCQTKEGVIADLNDLIEKVETEGADFSEEQWEKVNKEFETLVKEAEKFTDWSADEAAELTKAKAKYLGVQMKKGGENIMKKANKAMQGFMEGLGED